MVKKLPSNCTDYILGETHLDNALRENGFPLILVGMGRSGTSLLASWLQKNGVSIGENLMGASVGNVNGHFEDIGIVTLHDSWLKKRGLNWCTAVASVLPTNEEKDQGRKIVSELLKNDCVWGWKDPRTCLYLNLWDDLIQNAHYLVVFRDPDEVVNSLLRRDKEWCQKGKHDFLRKILCMPRLFINRLPTKYKYYRAWRTYNECILDFLEKDGVFDRTLVLSIDNFLSNSVDVMTFMQREWDYPLGQSDINDVYEPDKFKAEKSECILRVQKLNDAVMKKLKHYEQMTFGKIKQKIVAAR